MFALSEKSLDPARLKSDMAHPEAGACAEFEGWVRNHNEGRDVASLEYEAFPELAEHEGARILAEVCAQFEVIEAACVHRTGHLNIGELAVWVGVTARHRDAAFRACRAIIDAVKARVPIWKRERYVDGTAEWVRCEACHAGSVTGAAHGRQGGERAAWPPPLPIHDSPSRLSPGGAAATRPDSDAADERDFYRRQIALPQVGAEGQRKLKAARVLVIGAGGLGCPALRYLAAAGVGRITVYDGDRVEASNLHRQVLFDHADIGRNKAEVAAEKLRAQNPFIAVEAVAANWEATRGIEGTYTVALDCTDNFEAKFAIHDACRRAGVPLAQAALYRFEGQVQVFRPGADAGCLRCLWPEAPEDGCVESCADAGVLGVVPGVLGSMQAAEALKLILGLPGVCDREMAMLDLLTLDLHRVARPRNPNCPLCGAGAVRAEAQTERDWTVDAGELTPHSLTHWHVVDIRGADERQGDPVWVQGLAHIAWTELDAFQRLDPRSRYLLACAHGVRSRKLVRRLRTEGFTNFYSLRQGIGALAPQLERR